MALTVTLTGDWMGSLGDRTSTAGTIDFDSSYPTGGEPITAAQVGLGAIDIMTFEPKGGYTFAYNPTAKKVLVFVASSVAAHSHDLLVKGGQAAATTNVAATYATNILGKEAASDVTVAGADSATKGGVLAHAGAAGGALAEVANATNLSALTGVRFFAIGK